MFKVIYHWKVAAERRTDFEAAWRDMTLSIRSQLDGARGSLLLRDAKDPTLYTAVASWVSQEARELASTKGSANPDAGARMQAAAQFLGSEIYDVVEDLSV